MCKYHAFVMGKTSFHYRVNIFKVKVTMAQNKLVSAPYLETGKAHSFGGQKVKGHRL